MLADTKCKVVISKVFRLRSGSNYWEGRLEVLHDLYWGSVCGKGFTLTHGDIACKSLGFGKAQEVFPSANSGYGRGVGMIWKGDFECDNPLTADSLLECDSSKWGFSSCRYDHVFDVGIKCNVPTPERKVSIVYTLNIATNIFCLIRSAFWMNILRAATTEHQE